jgi:hypothetical protein
VTPAREKPITRSTLRIKTTDCCCEYGLRGRALAPQCWGRGWGLGTGHSWRQLVRPDDCCAAGTSRSVMTTGTPGGGALRTTVQDVPCEAL